jgi:hypothetical protein
MRQAILTAGQSNDAGYSPMVNLKGSGLVTQPAHPGSAPDFVATSDQSAINEWTGAAAASLDSGVQYPYPTLANAPCLYAENRSNTTSYYDGWGTYVKQYRDPNNGGALTDFSSYGPELSFLAKFAAAYPSTPLAAVKCAVGGTGLAANWLPANTGSNNTGTDRDCYAMFKAMIQQAAARLDASDGAGNWQWAGFLWYQGESGAHSATTAASDATYLADARLLFAAVRGLTRSDLPIIVARIGDNWGWGNVGDATDATNANPYLTAAGFPWAAIDYSINNTDGRTAGSQTTRNSYLAGARQRRATQVTLGGDANCTWFSTDGLPVRPPYDLTSATNDLAAYHWAGPGNMAVGERAFAAWNAKWGGKVRVATRGGKFSLRPSAA